MTAETKSSLNLGVLQVFESPFPKRRIGAARDAGYVVAETWQGEISTKPDFLLSAGVGDSLEFECDLLNRIPGLTGVAFDGTVDSCPQRHPNLTWRKMNIGSAEDATASPPVTDLKGILAKHRNVFLKMDIEGAEFDWIRSAETLNNIHQIVIEIHWPMASEARWACLSRLQETHVLVHLHANNNETPVPFGSEDDPILIPRVFECTYLRRDLFPSPPTPNRRPLPDRNLDASNRADLPDMDLNYWPFVTTLSGRSQSDCYALPASCLKDDVPVLRNGGPLGAHLAAVGEAFLAVGQTLRATEFWRWFVTGEVRRHGTVAPAVDALLLAHQAQRERGIRNYEKAVQFLQMAARLLRTHESEIKGGAASVTYRTAKRLVEEEMALCAGHSDPLARRFGLLACDRLLARGEFQASTAAEIHRRRCSCVSLVNDLLGATESKAESLPQLIGCPQETDYCPTNPCITRLDGNGDDGERTLINLRFVNYEILSDGSFRIRDPDGVSRSRNMCIIQDAKSKSSGISSFWLPTWDDWKKKDNVERGPFVLWRGLEDVRMIQVKGGNSNQCHFVATCCQTPGRFNKPTTVLGVLDLAAQTIVSMTALQYPLAAQAEKNWAPLVYRDRLLLVYRLFPTTILLEPNAQTGACPIFREVVQVRRGWPIALDCRGSSQWVEVAPGQYLAVVHEVCERAGSDPRVYTHRFCILNASDGWSVMLSPPFCFEDRHQIEFCCGLMFSTGGSVTVSYSVRDASAKQLVLSLERLLQVIEQHDSLLFDSTVEWMLPA